MTITPEWLTELRARHGSSGNFVGGKEPCDCGAYEWPCDTIVLLDALAAAEDMRDMYKDSAEVWEVDYRKVKAELTAAREATIAIRDCLEVHEGGWRVKEGWAEQFWGSIAEAINLLPKDAALAGKGEG